MKNKYTLCLFLALTMVMTPLSFGSLGEDWPGVKGPEDEKIDQLFKSQGRLIDRVTKREFPVSDFPNAFEGVFDLSFCKEMDLWLTITTSPDVFFQVENNGKTNLLITTYLSIKQYVEKYPTFERVIETWDKNEAPVGFFWRYSHMQDRECFDYHTSISLMDISSGNLLSIWMSQGCTKEFVSGMYLSALENLMFYCLPLDQIKESS